MERPRQDPDKLLRAIRRDTDGEHRGKLKIFFGYAAGVGKTYAMLRAAHKARERGADVAVGYIEPHARPQTAALLAGLERLPAKQIQYGGIILSELDLDAVLKRKPQLVLVDEYAHTNAEGCRHAKRYQDVQELLSAGIDVYTTVNVQHIESLNDVVASVTNVLVRERIPDSAFDRADQVELIDIEPEELLERLASGNIYKEKQAQRAAVNFFTLENLTALREIALRRCADRVTLLTEAAKVRSRVSYHTDEHILVCLSSSPSNPRIIRTAARMARAFRGAFTALFVETLDTALMKEEDKQRLRENMRLAQQLGATVETSCGEDVPYQIAEFARLSDVSQIVIGRSTAARRSIFGKPALTDRLISSAPNLDIHVIPDANAENYRYTAEKAQRKMTLRDWGRMLAALLFTTLLGQCFYASGFTEANIIACYIFCVLFTSIVTTSRLCGFISSLGCVLAFDFFFTAPRWTMHFYNPDYIITFSVMFLVAFFSGSLAARLKDIARQSAHAAFRTKILLETNQLLQNKTDEQAVVCIASEQLIKLLKKDIVVYLAGARDLLTPHLFRSHGSEQEDLLSENEKAAAVWAFRNNRQAGATTDTLPGVKCLYLPIRLNQKAYGVVGIEIPDAPLDAFENSVVLSILGECALALENIKNIQAKEKASLLAKSEQLRSNLLHTISHDLRTPLTSISGSAGNLLANYRKMDDAAVQQTFKDIYNDSLWLISLVENLLAVTRVEGNRISLKQSVELLEEVIAEALRHVDRKGTAHTLQIDASQDLLLVNIDVKLIVQVFINLVDNAIKYTPDGSVISIRTQKQGEWVAVSVADNGPGIPDEQKPHIFEMFYSGANKISDSRRSLGLGLALCKSIVAAHGGTLSVADNKPHGSVFTFTLPAGEVTLHE